MKKAYEQFCKFEELIALILLSGITILVFGSAMMRTFGMPLNWAQDAALVAFAWLIFFGSDIAMRGEGLIGVDIFVKKFPATVQKALDVIFKVIIIAFLAVLVIYGYQMTVSGWAREITTLGISYGFVTMAVPVGSFCMIISTCINLVNTIKTPAGERGGNR
ncbi:MAG: TRAP transporter small permease [Cellulosilyticum sp.]|nr:TRAP transporter small permease [Cellulosilyticum sp.]